MKAPANLINGLARSYMQMKITTQVPAEDGGRLLVAGEESCQLIFSKGEGGVPVFVGGALEFGGMTITLLEDFSFAVENEEGELGYLEDEALTGILVKHLELLHQYNALLLKRLQASS